ncbi:MAG: UDP-N-acetylmuramoyl-L-alanyl-D-glutamate--2,6-diaminopimelate ligase [Peptostreptococcaceae bacterium]|nr:UDP-N-acetylmuramoyl-L-alanyl-D-glutamate--2,6-diaminopimelate ligase [Peptostreptococcaceae bacterium]
MILKEILDKLDYEFFKGDKNLDIKGLCYDSRMAKKGFAFFCVKGFLDDGNKYYDDAINNGAKLIVSQEKLELKEDISFLMVKDVRKFMSLFSNIFYSNPSSKLKVFGVTGTNGKTSTTYFIKNILNELNKKSGMIGTVEIDNGKEIIKSVRTTPESTDVQKYFRTMLDEKIEFCPMEVSSHSLDLYRVEDVEFYSCVFTNLTSEHLDFHKNMKNYMESKKKLFYKSKVFNIINKDDIWGKKIIEDIKDLNSKIITYSIDEESNFKASNIEFKIDKVIYDLSIDFDDLKLNRRIEVKIPARFSVYNSLAAIATLVSYGFDIDDIKPILKDLKTVPGRIENITPNEEFSVIIDYAHTQDALEKVLKSINEFKPNKIITVFGCGGNRDKSKRPKMGFVANKYSSKVIITEDNPRFELSKDIINDIIEGIEDLTDVEVIYDRKEAIKKALEIVDKDDVILIAGKGHEDYQIIKDKKIHFSDKEVVEELIKEAKNGTDIFKRTSRGDSWRDTFK